MNSENSRKTADENSETGYSCKRCDSLDSDRMVMCDKCDNWYHYSCVGVDSNVANHSWSCGCKEPPPASSASNITNVFVTSPASSSSPKTTSTTTKTTFAEQTYGAAALYQQFFPVSKGMGVVSTMGMTGPQVCPTTMSAFIPASMVNVTAGTFTGTQNPNTLPFGGTIPTYIYGTQSTPMWRPPYVGVNQQAQASSNMNVNYQQQQQQAQASSNVRFPTTAEKANLNSLQRQTVLQLERLEEEKRIHQEFLEQKYKILAQENLEHSAERVNITEVNNCPSNQRISPPINMPSAATSFYAHQAVPTASQLAARRCIPRELPPFNGDPDEWPIFINNYENTTAIAGFSNAENLMRLQSCLKGKARDVVKSKLLLPALVPDIIATLRLCFGRPEHILERAINKAKNTPSPRDKLESIIEFAINVQNICATMESCGLESHLNNPMLVKELVDKLPTQHKLNWAMLPKDGRTPVVKAFSVWLYQIAEAASTVVTPNFGKGGAAVNTHTLAHDNAGKICPVCKINAHKVEHCDRFKNMQLNEKWDAVRANSLCRQCLHPHKRKCRLNKDCGVNGCKFKHHSLLHKTKDTVSPSVSQTVSTNALATTSSAQLNAHNDAEEEKPFFRILPITIFSKNSFVNTFAFLDEGSSVTLIERSIFNNLNLDGEPDPLCLQWTGGTTRVESDSVRTSIQISSGVNDTKFTLSDVRTVRSLDLPTQTINIPEIIKRFPYLRDLPIKSYHNAKPMVLIGANNWKLAVPIKIREGSWQQPIATKTRLGWTLQGGSGNCSTEHRVHIHTCTCQSDELHNLVKTYFSMESPTPSTIQSEQDARAMATLKATCKKINGRFEVGLLWKNDDVHLPESYANAFRRLMCLHKKFAKTPSLRQNMQEQINNLIEKGYASKLSPTELAAPVEKVWYLPTFIALNPNKPKKLRLVWDAAAKANGASLNDFMVSGPDLLKPLVEILLAFRVGKVAICGDISEMFHRITVRESDMHAQRFLWCDEDDDLQQPSIYVMRALTFGISCAPCIAHYVRDTNAEAFKSEFPRAVEAIQKYHYVDDLIDSEDTEEKAANLAKQVSRIHADAGFCIRNWASNSVAVLQQLTDVSTMSQETKLWGGTEKVLGMYWDPVKDVFKYICRFARLRRNVVDEDIVPSKRECLQVLMSIFDPLGFLSCYTVGLKILLQNIWRSGIGWDDPLPESLFVKWSQWKSTIPLIKNIEIPRWCSPILNESQNIHLHTFVDAGEYAYSAVTYLVVKLDDRVTVTLIGAKSKVAPLKPLSVPRMELQAALIGVRLAIKIQNVERLHISSLYWWSDSKTVLQWLRMDPRNFPQFVMHRVGEILEHTNATQWRWVPTKINPADLATKTNTHKNMALWFDGPEFLRNPADQWPLCEDSEAHDNSEIRRPILLMDTKSTTTNSMYVEYFSKWKRLYRAVATFLLYLTKLKDARKQKESQAVITQEMIQQAQRYIIKEAQRTEFQQEILDLKRGNTIGKSSKLFRLNAYLDEHEVIRCHSRAKQLNNHDDEIVLPNRHYVTFLIVRSYHEDFHHQLHEAVINRVKGQYYIPRLRILYKKVRKSCQICKNNSVIPQPPQMALLPAARLGAFQRPFTYVGVGYFGPLLVAVGRRREKRWGVVFTCLTIRAIHIEIAHSLDTSSCILCIRNFAARRGTPREIYSDNGTNFKAAEKALKEDLSKIDYATINTHFDKTKWIFNPPGAPHMGGAWERLIRSVKNVLYSISPTQNFNDETLKGALCEIEAIINSRPLTFVSVDNEDDDAITPNHLLLGSCDGYKPFFDNSGNLRERWQRTQAFADQFWHRWLKEYIPIISRRSKWFTKVPPISIGAIVIIADENLPRRCWPKGKIIDTVIAADGQVRRVTVKTQFGVMQRPVTKIAVLDVGSDHEQARNPCTRLREGECYRRHANN